MHESPADESMMIKAHLDRGESCWAKLLVGPERLDSKGSIAVLQNVPFFSGLRLHDVVFLDMEDNVKAVAHRSMHAFVAMDYQHGAWGDLCAYCDLHGWALEGGIESTPTRPGMAAINAHGDVSYVLQLLGLFPPGGDGKERITVKEHDAGGWDEPASEG